MRFRTLMIAAAVLVALAGCSKDTGTAANTGPVAGAPTGAGTAAGGGAAGGGSVDPCSLITTAQASTVLGAQAKDGAGHSSTGTRQCQWDAASGPENGSIAILVYVGAGKSLWQSDHDTAKTAYASKFAEVPNLGDAAYSNGFDLQILKGSNVYQIGVSGPFTDNVARATTVAKEALANV
jgi:hypothetical protein